MNPWKESAAAKPLRAPRQSPAVLTHAPSTQLVVCATFTVIVLVGKFADAIVPVHPPDMSANGPDGAAGADGADVDAELGPDPPQALVTHATMTAAANAARPPGTRVAKTTIDSGKLMSVV
jgi:hypothetical protein